jgi:hypothetical protein
VNIVMVNKAYNVSIVIVCTLQQHKLQSNNFEIYLFGMVQKVLF